MKPSLNQDSNITIVKFCMNYYLQWYSPTNRTSILHCFICYITHMHRSEKDSYDIIIESITYNHLVVSHNKSDFLLSSRAYASWISHILFNDVSPVTFHSRQFTRRLLFLLHYTLTSEG